MEKLTELTDDQKKYAVDLMVTLAVKELSEKQQEDPAKVLREFVASKTGVLLYDESSKLWWRGPSDIAQMYRQEIEGMDQDGFYSNRENQS